MHYAALHSVSPVRYVPLTDTGFTYESAVREPAVRSNATTGSIVTPHSNAVDYDKHRRASLVVEGRTALHNNL